MLRTPERNAQVLGLEGDFLRERAVTSGTAEIEIVVEKEPVWVGLDPFRALIDRNTDNGVVAATAR